MLGTWDHGSRFQPPGARFQPRGSRFPPPKNRFQLPGSRFQLIGSRVNRLQIPTSTGHPGPGPGARDPKRWANGPRPLGAQRPNEAPYRYYFSSPHTPNSICSPPGADHAPTWKQIGLLFPGRGMVRPRGARGAQIEVIRFTAPRGRTMMDHAPTWKQIGLLFPGRGMVRPRGARGAQIELVRFAPPGGGPLPEVETNRPFVSRSGHGLSPRGEDPF